MNWDPESKRMSDQGVSFGLALAHLLKDTVFVSPNLDGSIILEERSANMRVELSKPPVSLTIINVSRLSHLSMLKDGEWKKICDYLLVAEQESKIHACFVELKRTLTNESAPREQLRRSLPILEYLRSICEVQYGRKDWPASLTVQYSLIAARLSERLNKQRVRHSPSAWPEVECYGDIEVRKFVGTRIAVSKLL